MMDWEKEELLVCCAYRTVTNSWSARVGIPHISAQIVRAKADLIVQKRAQRPQVLRKEPDAANDLKS